MASGADLKRTPTSDEQNTLTRPASTTTAAMADAEEPAECLPSNPVLPNDEVDGLIGDLVAVDAKERAGVKRRLCNLQESCCNKRQRSTWKCVQGGCSSSRARW